jgi:hypothetical protein
MIETVIGIGVSLVQSLYEKYQDSNEEKRKAIIDTLKKMDKAAVATRMYINDNANYRDFRGYNMRTRLHLFELWNEAAYTALVIDFNTGMLLRQKSYYWSDPNNYEQNEEVGSLPRLDDLFREIDNKLALIHQNNL